MYEDHIHGGGTRCFGGALLFSNDTRTQVDHRDPEGGGVTPFECDENHEIFILLGNYPRRQAGLTELICLANFIFSIH